MYFPPWAFYKETPPMVTEMSESMHRKFQEDVLDYVREFFVTKDGFENLDDYIALENQAIRAFANRLIKEIK